jgi:phage terminase large subunit-like protein
MSNLPVPDLTEFVKKYLQMKLPINWHHRLFYDILANKIMQKEDGKLYFTGGAKTHYEYNAKNPKHKNRNILVLAPRFHAKSQCFTINYPIWEMYKNPNIRILIVSANEDIAVSFNRAIINHLENNQKLIEELGYLVPQYPKKWGEKAIIVKRDTMEKDPTIAAIGVGGKLISRRADIIIIDDLLDIETARTKQMRQKTKDWFENVLLPILEDEGRLIIVGTSWYRGDLYDDLLNDSKFDIRLKLKALIFDGNMIRSDGAYRYTLPYNIIDFPFAQKAQDILSKEVMLKYDLFQYLKDGVLWKEKWSFDKLMKKKENMSNASFMRQYLNEPVIEEEKVFSEKILKKATERGSQKALLPYWDNLNPPNNYQSYGNLITAIGVDLAISKSDESANSAISVWGINEKRERILLWLDYGKWSPEETKQKIIEAYYNYRPVKVKVETVAYQDMMRQELASDNIPVEGFRTTAGRKFNPETGLAHIAMLMEQEKVIIPSAKTNKEYFSRVRQLLYEMSIYTYESHAGDLLMASWFALDTLRDYDNKMRENRGFFSTSGVVSQMKAIKAASRIVLLGYKPPVYKLAPHSLIYVYVPINADTLEPFFSPDDKFFIFFTREERSIGYIFNKKTSEIIGKLDGDLNALTCATLLEKMGYFFNTAQIVVERSGEGDSIYLELFKRNYPSLLCMQPDEKGYPTMKEGFRLTASNLPIITDYFKQVIDGNHIQIPDEAVVKDLGELIKVEGDKLLMGFGTGQKIKTVATGIWLLDNWENSLKKEKSSIINKKKKTLNIPYLVFK